MVFVHMDGPKCMVIVLDSGRTIMPLMYLFVLQGKIAGGENRGLVMQDGILQMIFSADYSVHTAVEFEK